MQMCDRNEVPIVYSQQQVNLKYEKKKKCESETDRLHDLTLESQITARLLLQQRGNAITLRERKCRNFPFKFILLR